MQSIIFDYEGTSLAKKNDILSLANRLMPRIEHIKNFSGKNYSSPYAFINIPYDRDLPNRCLLLVREKRKLNIHTLLIIGIGGSNLGTMAVEKAVRGVLGNDGVSGVKVYYAETVDPEYCKQLLTIIENELQQKKKILINIITKSGTTLETIVNAEIFLKLLMQYHPHDYQRYVVITTDHGSPLWYLAQKKELAVLEIPKELGGRFSVFSAVGLFPLAFLDIDIHELLSGARHAMTNALEAPLEKNYAALSAAIKFYHYERNIIMHDFFIFSLQLEALGKWYRQLIAESLGKEFDVNNNRVQRGIMPLVSVGSTDLHSVGQLYLGGPSTTLTTFISVDNAVSLETPSFAEFESCVPHIQHKPVCTIMNALIAGTKHAYREKQRPFCSLILPELNAFDVGHLLQMSMIEIIFLSYFLEVNPFDQPNVELYKEKTKELLAQ